MKNKIMTIFCLYQKKRKVFESNKVNESTISKTANSMQNNTIYKVAISVIP